MHPQAPTNSGFPLVPRQPLLTRSICLTSWPQGLTTLTQTPDRKDLSSTCSWVPISPDTFCLLCFIVYKTHSHHHHLPQLTLGRIKWDTANPSTEREIETQRGSRWSKVCQEQVSGPKPGPLTSVQCLSHLSRLPRAAWGSCLSLQSPYKCFAHQHSGLARAQTLCKLRGNCIWGEEGGGGREGLRRFNLSFFLQSLFWLLLWDFFSSNLGLWFILWIFSEYGLFLPPPCPAPRPALLENQSSLFCGGWCREDCSGIRAAQVQHLVLPFYSFTYRIIQHTHTHWAITMH